MRITRTVAATATLALAATGVVLGPAGQAAAPKPDTLAKGLVSPLSAAVDDDGTAYVTQNFAGLLSRIRPGKKPKTVYASQNGNEVGGVSVLHGKLVFTETKSGGDQNPIASWVKWITPSGKVKTLANVRAYENKKNPDQKVTYGIPSISAECAAQWPTDMFGPPSYQGVPDSHPYATLQVDEGTVYVADAGMNAVLAISPKGKIRTLAVTPRVPVELTSDVVAAMQLPTCVTGLTYYGESVPTDLALGSDKKLYVTTEGGGLGESAPLGSVYSVDLKSGKTKQVVAGLFAPTGIALAPNDDMYVAQLFGGQISRIKHGTTKVKTFAKTPLPAAVEWTTDGLYATTNVLAGPSEENPDAPPGGKLVVYGK